MNKKLILLIGSLFALMIAFNHWNNGFLYFQDQDVAVSQANANNLYIVHPDQLKTIPESPSIGTKPCKPDKNLIRIKAWDNVLSYDTPPIWRLPVHFDHSEKIKFVSFSATMLTYDLAVAYLRGPPQPVLA
jgi:hypothetical protein